TGWRAGWFGYQPVRRSSALAPTPTGPGPRLDVRTPNHVGIPPPGTAEPQAQNRRNAAQWIRIRVLKRRTPPDGYREGKPLPPDGVRAPRQSVSAARQGPSRPPGRTRALGTSDSTITDVVALLWRERIRAPCSVRGTRGHAFQRAREGLLRRPR